MKSNSTPTLHRCGAQELFVSANCKPLLEIIKGIYTGHTGVLGLELRDVHDATWGP